MESRKRRLLVAGSVKAELARQRMSPEQLADAARISLSVLTRMLAGEQPFDVEKLDAIARVLGVSVASLLNDE